MARRGSPKGPSLGSRHISSRPCASLDLRAFPGFETFSESYSYLPISVTAGVKKIYFLSCELALVGVHGRAVCRADPHRASRTVTAALHTTTHSHGRLHYKSNSESLSGRAGSLPTGVIMEKGFSIPQQRKISIFHEFAGLVKGIANPFSSLPKRVGLPGGSAAALRRFQPAQWSGRQAAPARSM